MASSKKRKIIRYFLLIFWALVFGWQFFQMNARGFDKANVLASDQDILFAETDEYLSFIPQTDSVNTSVLFFPGALVQPEAYAPLAKKLAQKGYSFYIQKIPFRIAVTDNMEQNALINTSKFISTSNEEKWVVAGHSRGGRMAVNYASLYPESISGLVLMGTTHPKDKDLSRLEFPVLKISASEDGLASPPEIDQFAHNLPDSTDFFMIQGGNHSQFGYYGFQLGAGSPTITREEQQKIIFNVVEKFLRNSKF
ncbi:MAG: alpha/beta fold hydrolase [Balneola sp.]|jgi:pimeloyl-ACP methyl ester carboxylesterase|tara:strand:- start:60207 stop:60965 length:759 start_codon:yes stop_codon:yes gene_type:complete